MRKKRERPVRGNLGLDHLFRMTDVEIILPAGQDVMPLAQQGADPVDRRFGVIKGVSRTHNVVQPCETLAPQFLLHRSIGHNDGVVLVLSGADWPFGASTPITRNIFLLIRMSRPTASSGSEELLTHGLSDQANVGATCTTSPFVNGSPSASSQRLISRNSGVTPR